MGSIEKSIIHDHIYSTNIEEEKDCNQAKYSSNKKEDSSCSHHRIIRTKRDIQTEIDHEEYVRRRSLNNTSCRISRLHRRSKLDFIIKNCAEYEDMNTN